MKKLVIDVETSPNVVLEFDIYSSTPRSPDSILEPTRILCFAYKWVGDRGVSTCAEWDEGGHEAMIRKAHELLSEADAVVHFNGTRFDTPHFNREFAELGLAPPAPYEQIDLYSTVKKRFKFPSGRLAYVSRVLDIKEKGDSGGMDTWRKVLIENDEKARARMLRYNARDVIVTEQLYKKLLAWIPGHPNATSDGREACPTCGGRLVGRGYARTRTRIYQRFQCKDCGAWSRSTRSEGGATVVGASL